MVSSAAESVISPLPELGAALAVGALIGLERGWQERQAKEGGRVAGLRTFALVGLFGGVCASLPTTLSPWAVVAGMLGLAMLAGIGYRESAQTTGRLSATSALAMLLTFALGALAAGGAALPAAAAAVVTAVLLNQKTRLHGLLQAIDHRELTTALQLLVVSVVVLPLLPDRALGPYAAVNPRELWWAVVLVLSLSLAGHVAMRTSGPERGTLWTGLLGGLTSSTAATLALARQVSKTPALLDAATAGILAAAGMMCVRVLVLVGVLRPALMPLAAPPVAAACLTLLTMAWIRWRRVDGTAAAGEIPVAPLDIGVALAFAAFLAFVSIATQATRAYFGSAGVYASAAMAGLADVDAIVVSLLRLADGSTSDDVVVTQAIAVAMTINAAAKGVMAWMRGGPVLARRFALAHLLAGAAGLAAAAGVHA